MCLANSLFRIHSIKMRIDAEKLTNIIFILRDIL